MRANLSLQGNAGKLRLPFAPGFALRRLLNSDVRRRRHRQRLLSKQGPSATRVGPKRKIGLWCVSDNRPTYHPLTTGSVALARSPSHG